MRRVVTVIASIVVTVAASASPIALEQAIEGTWGLDREASMNTRSIADCDVAPTRFELNREGDRAASISILTPAAPITTEIEIDTLTQLAEGELALEVRMPVNALMTVYPAERIVFELRDAVGRAVPGHTVVLQRCPEQAMF